MAELKAVLSVIGADQKGVVARFATHLAERGANILDLEQQVVHGRFLMDMLVDISDVNLSLDQLTQALEDLGNSLNMQVRINLYDPAHRQRVAVLVSKESQCLDQLIEDWQFGRLHGELVCVLSNHPDLEPKARQAGIPFEHHPSDDKQAHFQWIAQKLADYQADLAVLARYMQVLPPEIVQRHRHRIINIHPSLLPYFPGARPYHRAWEEGVRVAGCTSHFVTEELDAGPIILQDVFHIDVGKDSADDVKTKGRQLEGQVLSQAVQMFLDEKLIVVDGKVVFRPGVSRFLEHERQGSDR